MTLSTLRELAAELGQLRARGGRGAVATLVATKGSSANLPGNRLLLTDEEKLVGDVTLGGCASPRLLQVLREVYETGVQQTLPLNLGEENYEFGLTCAAQLELSVQPYRPGAENAYLAVLETLSVGQRAGLITHQDGLQTAFSMDDILSSSSSAVQHMAHTLSDANPKANLVCLYKVGQSTVLLEHFIPPLHLILVGAGGVAVALAALAHTLDFRVTVIAAEPLQLTLERFPYAERCCVPCTEEALDARSLNSNDHLVFTSHNYADEITALPEAVLSEVSYLGMVASYRRGQAVLDFLGHLGVPPAQRERIRTPAGLDIAAATPAEIALSIFAEILAKRGGKGGLPFTQPEVIPRGNPELVQT